MNEIIAQAKEAIARADYELAVRLIRPLADAGHAGAQFLLGYLYFTGADVAKDDSREWLKRAAAQDHAEALYYLSGLGDTYDSGPPEDDSRRSMLIRAAELGASDVQRDLGCYYATGEGGLPQDETLGRFWYSRAAAQGHADAQYNYGCMLLYGEGGPADLEMGKAMIRKAAANGDPCAIHFLSDELN